jgi:hypothetical protein
MTSTVAAAPPGIATRAPAVSTFGSTCVCAVLAVARNDAARDPGAMFVITRAASLGSLNKSSRGHPALDPCSAASTSVTASRQLRSTTASAWATASARATGSQKSNEPSAAARGEAPPSPFVIRSSTQRRLQPTGSQLAIGRALLSARSGSLAGGRPGTRRARKPGQVRLGGHAARGAQVGRGPVQPLAFARASPTDDFSSIRWSWFT